MNDLIVDVIEYKKSDGTSDFFVRIQRNGRELTPYSFPERWKAEYSAAEFQWLFGQREEEPDFEDFDPEWKALKNG